MKRIKLSESQDLAIRKIIRENLDSNPNTNQNNNGVKVAGGTVKTDFTPDRQVTPQEQLKLASDASRNTRVNGQDTPTETEMNISGEDKTITISNESVIISKKQLNEVKLKRLKKNSRVVKLKHFIK